MSEPVLTMGMTHKRACRQFRELFIHHHARSGKTCGVVAELAGLSPAYLKDLLAGRRWRISLHALRKLCDYGWQVNDREGQELLRWRLEADVNFVPRCYLPIELIWCLTSKRGVREIAAFLGLDPSYASQVITGRRRPSLDVLMSIYAKLGLDTHLAVHLYAVDIQPYQKSVAKIF